MSTVLGLDLFSLNGIPSNIEAMHTAFPFGWYQISNGMTVGIMTRKAWPAYAKYYGGYHYFNPNPDGNWIFQSWRDYAEACAWLFLDSMKGDYGACAPMIDVEAQITPYYLQLLYPTMSPVQQAQQGNILYFQMLKIICDLLEQETEQIPILYTGNGFWSSISGQTQAWAARLPLMVAIYPFDNYAKESDYEAAIQSVMNGTSQLSSIQIPLPWTQATYIQFTGRAPATLVPGYAAQANWAKTVDISIQVGGAGKEAVGSASQSNLYSTNGPVNVRAGSTMNSQYLGNLPQGTIVIIDNQAGDYSHFPPTPQFPGGGWLYTSFLVKVTP